MALTPAKEEKDSLGTVLTLARSPKLTPWSSVSSVRWNKNNVLTHCSYSLQQGTALRVMLLA